MASILASLSLNTEALMAAIVIIQQQSEVGSQHELSTGVGHAYSSHLVLAYVMNHDSS